MSKIHYGKEGEKELKKRDRIARWCNIYPAFLLGTVKDTDLYKMQKMEITVYKFCQSMTLTRIISGIALRTETAASETFTPLSMMV